MWRHTDNWLQVKIVFPSGGDAHLLHHVQFTWQHPIRQLPVKMVQEASQSNLNVHMSETCPRAHPPPSPERSELKIEPLVVQTAVVRVTLKKSLWYKHVWVLPVFGSLEITQTFATTIVPCGTWYPWILMRSSKHTLGTNGAGGCRVVRSL